MRKYLFVIVVSGFLFGQAAGQSSNDSLIAQATRADSAFWIAYNQCDVEGMMRYIPTDIQFYHDKGGITLGDSAFRASIQNGLCSDERKFRLRREIVPGTGNANPMMKNGQVYGVLMTGKHVFHSSKNGEPEHADGIAQYADLWLMQEGEWKMARVFSYDHRPVPQANQKAVVSVPAAILKEYAGVYRGGPSGNVTVQPKKGYLTIISTNSSLDVYPSSNTSFFAKDRDLNFLFAKKGAGVVDLTVKENGQVVDTYTSSRR